MKTTTKVNTMNRLKRISIALLSAATLLVISGCSDDARIAKLNTAKAADNFEINRRIIFYNTWTDTVIQKIEGLCSIDYSSRVSVICKIGTDSNGNAIVKNSLIALNGQVTVFVEQLDSLPVNVYHYRRTFKPQSIIPDIDFRGDSSAVIDALAPDNND